MALPGAARMLSFIIGLEDGAVAPLDAVLSVAAKEASAVVRRGPISPC
jgi:hypothetical protein